MDYQKIYNDIIQKAKTEDRKKGGDIYYESHHILPKCMGGDDLITNRVLLTAKEHFICHKLLHFENQDDHKLFFSYFMMYSKTGLHKRDYKISSREYEKLKIKNGIFMSEVNTGIVRSAETRHKMSIRNISDDYRKNLRISQSNMPKVKCPHCGKEGKKSSMYVWHFDHCFENPDIDLNEEKRRRKHSKERVLNNKNFHLNVESVKCPHCGKVGQKYAMKRYHFDNCMKNPNLDRSKVIICDVCGKESNDLVLMKKWHFDNCKHAVGWEDKREVLKCPWCNLESKSKSNMKRYHFDNCKQRI